MNFQTGQSLAMNAATILRIGNQQIGGGLDRAHIHISIANDSGMLNIPLRISRDSLTVSHRLQILKNSLMNNVKVNTSCSPVVFAPAFQSVPYRSRNTSEWLNTSKQTRSSMRQILWSSPRQVASSPIASWPTYSHSEAVVPLAI